MPNRMVHVDVVVGHVVSSTCHVGSGAIYSTADAVEQIPVSNSTY